MAKGTISEAFLIYGKVMILLLLFLSLYENNTIYE